MPRKSKTTRESNLPVPAEKRPGNSLGGHAPAIQDAMELATRDRPGQPTKRNPELVEKMCLLMMRGSSLLMVCQRDDMPGYSTVMRWCKEDPLLLEQFDQAREMTAYAIDEFNEVIARGIKPFATGDFRRDELLVKVNDQRKRHLNRRRFGEKVQLDVVQTQVFVMPGDVIDGEGY